MDVGDLKSGPANTALLQITLFAKLIYGKRHNPCTLVTRLVSKFSSVDLLLDKTGSNILASSPLYYAADGVEAQLPK